MSEAAPPRAVFDCMIFLQGAARSAGPAKACLDLAENGFVQLCLSPEVINEVRDVLTRPETQRKFPALIRHDVDEFIEKLSAKAAHFPNVPSEFRFERDPKDAPYINLALAAQASYLVTRDTDLPSLMDESKDPGKTFRASYPFLAVIGPVTFLTEIRKQIASEQGQSKD